MTLGCVIRVYQVTSTTRALAGRATPIVKRGPLFSLYTSQMQRIAVILQPKVIRSILDCLQEKGRSP